MLGDGSQIRFWEDKWCGEFPLCDQFPTLYAMVASKGLKWERSGTLQEAKEDGF